MADAPPDLPVAVALAVPTLDPTPDPPWPLADTFAPVPAIPVTEAIPLDPAPALTLPVPALAP